MARGLVEEDRQGSVDVALKAGVFRVPITDQSKVFGTEMLLWKYEDKTEKCLGKSSSGSKRTAQIAAIKNSYAGNQRGFVAAMDELPGKFQWTYLSSGLRYQVSFVFDGTEYFFGDDPSTVAIEKEGVLVGAYERIPSNEGRSSDLVAVSFQEASKLGWFELPASVLEAKLKKGHIAIGWGKHVSPIGGATRSVDDATA